MRKEFKKELSRIKSLETLKTIWGVRLLIDLLFIGYLAYLAITGNVPDMGWGFALGFGFALLVEKVVIISLLMKKGWGIGILHIYALCWLFIFPIGSIMSVLHFYNVIKLKAFFKIDFQAYS
jgi:hypothetical protein